MPDDTLTTSLLSSRSEVDAIADLATAAKATERLQTGTVIGVSVADGSSYHVLDLERFDDAPRRKRGEVYLTDPSSFEAYVTRHLIAEQTTLWGERDPGTVTAIIDDHAATPGWGDHVARLVLRKTEPWKRWVQSSGQTLSQLDFAELVEERIEDIVEPSGAEMLELAKSLQATKSTAFRSELRLDNGATQFLFDETIDARAGQKGEITIPRKFALALKVWEGTDAFRVEARFRFRLDGGRLLITYHLDRLDDVTRECFSSLTDAIASNIGAPYFNGAPFTGARTIAPVVASVR